LRQEASDEPVIQSQETLHVRAALLIGSDPLAVGWVFRAGIVGDGQPSAGMRKRIRELFQALLNSAHERPQLGHKFGGYLTHVSYLKSSTNHPARAISARYRIGSNTIAKATTASPAL
jgi:hypothetical protein